MYAKWSGWDGKPLDEPPLFYQGADDFAAQVMTEVNDEVVIQTRDAIKKLKPELELSKVVSIHQWYINSYEEQTEDVSSLKRCLNTNAGYRGLTHSTIKTNDGKYMPNFNYRYMTEDLPMGLVPLRAIAELAGVATPM